MPNLKKKKESHLEEVIKDKMVIGFVAVVLVVSINFLVFSVLLDNNRQKVGAQGVNFLACGDVILTPGTTWHLAGNLDCTGMGTTGVTVVADNVTIDGQGYTIDGDIKDVFAGDASDFMPGYNEYDPTTWQWGVVAIDVNNLTIKNLHVANFFAGIGVGSTGPNITGTTIQNNTITNDVPYNLSFVTPPGIYLAASESSLVTQNNISGMGSPIILDGILNSTISNNDISGGWASGIKLQNSSINLTIENNNIKSSFKVGLTIDGGCTGNTVRGNNFVFNRKDISNFEASTVFIDNSSSHNIESVMIGEWVPDIIRNIGLGDTVDFQFGLMDASETFCPTCTYTVDINPTVILNNITQGVDGSGRPIVEGSFDATVAGTYSLQISVNDGSNTTYRNKMFYVNSTGSESSTYYFRAKEDIYPRAGFDSTHGQPKGRDDGAFLLTPPVEDETELCSKFVLNTVDELPDYPIGLVTEQNLSFWHKETLGLTAGLIRFGGNGGSWDPGISTGITQSPDANTYVYSSGEAVFSGLTNWVMDYPFSWYLMSFQFGRIWQPAPSDRFPFIQSRSASPSTNVITHVYPTTPAVKSISNSEILLLAAHPSIVNPLLNTITLDGSHASNHSVDITIDSYNYPFRNAITRINSDGTATLKASNVTSKTTFDSVNMAITPDSGYVDTNIITWDVGQSYYKKWSEFGSLSGINTAHVIFDMLPYTTYDIKVDGALFVRLVSNASGEITFNYDGGYSTHVFEVQNYSGGGIVVTEDMLADPESDTESKEPVVLDEISLPGDLQIGNVIKSASSNSVFVITSEGKRNVFSHENVFYSYFTSFENIIEVSDDIISQLPIGKNITMRPGTNMIKLQTNPSVYAVEPGGVLRMLENEAMAVLFYGENWAQRVVDVSDAFWPDYIEGDPLETAIYSTGTILRYLGNGDVWYIEEGIARLVSSEIYEINNYQEKYVVSNVMKIDFNYAPGEDLEVMHMFKDN